MRNQTFGLDNDIHKLFWGFDIPTDHLILAQRPDFIIITPQKKKNSQDLAVLTDHRIKLKVSGKKDK